MGTPNITLPMNQSFEQLPTGKSVVKKFADDGALIEELHSYGALAIGFQCRYESGVRVNETYFAKGRLVSRRTYEKARSAYSDMPSADIELGKWSVRLLQAVAKEKKERRAAEKTRQANPDEARRCHEFCEMILAKGRSDDAASWIDNRLHTIGERDWKSSKRLINQFKTAGCSKMYACEITSYDNGQENTGRLVLELPSETDQRNKIFKLIARLVRSTGYDAPFDDGQRFQYIELD